MKKSLETGLTTTQVQIHTTEMLLLLFIIMSSGNKIITHT